jgi:endonuclease/exonuclease/phosphatase (EEP) superfamily protein YafD
VRVFFANVLAENKEHQSLLEEIKAADPDIVVLVEFTAHWQAAFINSPIMAPYIHGSGKRQAHIGAVNVFSKLPLKSESQRWIANRVVQTVDIRIGGQSLRVIGLHSPRPMEPLKYDYPGFWREVTPLILSTQGPTLVVGDFNATEHSLVYAQLTKDKFRSAHDDRGRGFATTWPNGSAWLPPIRIDQALLSSEVDCLAIAEGIGRGSDHKPLIIDVRLRNGMSPDRTTSEGGVTVNGLTVQTAH